MTYDQLCEAIQKILPYADVAKDNDGQIIIYTNLCEPEEGDRSLDLVEYEV